MEAKAESRQQEISKLSRSLKILAKEMDCPVIVLSQLSRAVEQRMEKKPQLSDLRESGAIEQDADLVMFLYRDEYYNPETDKPNTCEMDKEEVERVNDILLYQVESMNRSMQKSFRPNESKSTAENAVKTQIRIYQSLPAFKRQMDKIKSSSVSKKTKEEKFKIYKEIKRKEAEKKKKEKEDEMFNKMLK